MSQPDSYLGLGAPIASSSTGQDHELDRNRLRELTQHQQLQDQPLMTQSVQPQPQTLHESGYTLTDVNHNIHGPTEMSNALLQGASEERIKVEQQIEVGKALAGDLQKGVTVHTFDPDASTAQKAREAAGIDPSSALAAGPSSARALVIDSAPASNLPAPTISVDDINRASREEGEGFGGEKVEPVVSSTQEVETLQKSTIGWLDSIGGVKSPNSITESSESIQRTPSRNWFTENIPLEFYGTAYHNAGLILFAVLSTRAITLLRLSWGWIVVLLAFCMTMYSISIERTRARARDDIQRELMKSRLVSESESADWINSLLDRAWLIAEPLLSATVVASVDEALKSAAFGPVESIRLTTFTLGNKAPRIDSIRTYPMTPDDEVIMEWALSFTPNDLEDLTPKQAKSKVNPKVVLSIKLGKGFVGGSIPVLLEDISFKGSMRIKLKLMSNFPHVQMVHMSFMEKPEFDYVLKPLGGEKFGMDVNNIPGLSGFIKDQVHANLGPMMYDPNVFTINLEQLLSGTPLDSAIGILKVTIESANGLKAVKLGGGAPDPYVVMGVGLKPAVNKTKVKHSTSHPVWNETQYILVNTLNESLNLSVFDYNEHRSDNALGTSVFDLASLITDAEQSGLSSKIVQDGKDRGSIKYNLSFYPVLTPKALPDGTLEPPPESSTGIVRLTIHQAKDLDLSRSSGTLSPYAAVYLGGNREIHRTATMKASNTPTWESATEFLVPDKTNSTITIKLFDDRALRDPSLGTAVIRLEDLLQAKDRQQDWFPLSGVRSGKVRITTDWKPLLLPGSVGGSAAYTAPIGVMRIWLKKAVDLKNLEFGLGGKSDPYVRVLLNHQILAKTEVVDNNLNPEWDEIVYIPVHHANDHVILEIMDHQNLTKDRHLGTVEVKVSDYILVDKANNETPYLSNGGKDRADAVLLGNGQADKGRLHYHVSFVPSVALKGGVHFEPVADPSKVLAGRPLNMPNGDSDNASLRSAIGDGGSVKEPEEEQSGVTLGINELLREQSGVLVLQVIAGMMPKKGRFEVLVDENATPSFQTEKARGHKNTWDQIGELVIRELDFSQLTLRMNENDPDDKPDVYAELRVLTRNLLEAAWDAPTTYILNVVGGATSEKTTVLLQARYVPLRMALEMRESVINMGILGVELIDAKGLQGSDRSGKSDPYVVFTLGGEKVFKSQVKKKTLAPTWNERFEAVVPSRFNSRFTFEIFDWNQIESAKSLGTGSIDLVSIEPFEASEVTLPVMTVKDGVRGTLRLRTVFTPQLIARVRRHTGTLSAAGRTLSTVGSTVGAAPIMVGKGVGHGLVAGGTGVVHGVGAVGTGVAHGVGAVGGFAGRKVGGLIKRKDKHGNEVLVEEPLMGEEGSYEVINERGHARMPSHKGSLAPSTTQAGRISITCLRAKGISGTASGDVKPYIVLQTDKQKYHTHHAKRSEEPEWNETFNFDASASALTVKMYDRKTIGKDKEVGEALIELNDLEGASAERWVELSNGRGQIYLRIDAGDAGAASLRRLKTPSMRSLVGGGGAGNTSSPGRFSFRKTGS